MTAISSRAGGHVYVVHSKELKYQVVETPLRRTLKMSVCFDLDLASILDSTAS